MLAPQRRLASPVMRRCSLRWLIWGPGASEATNSRGGGGLFQATAPLLGTSAALVAGQGQLARQEAPAVGEGPGSQTGWALAGPWWTLAAGSWSRSGKSGVYVCIYRKIKRYRLRKRKNCRKHQEGDYRTVEHGIVWRIFR